MARVRLYLDPADPHHEYRYVLPGEASVALPGLRLVAFARFLGRVADTPDGRRVAFMKCIVDTGAPLTIVPQDIWQHLRPGVVTPLAFDPSMPVHHRVLSIAGGTYPYTLGELTVPLVDRSGGSMPVRVLAELVQDAGALDIPILLGLRGGLFDGRRVVAEPDPAAPFGQSWAVEGP